MSCISFVSTISIKKRTEGRTYYQIAIPSSVPGELIEELRKGFLGISHLPEGSTHYLEISFPILVFKTATLFEVSPSFAEQIWRGFLVTWHMKKNTKECVELIVKNRKAWPHACLTKGKFEEFKSSFIDLVWNSMDERKKNEEMRRELEKDVSTILKDLEHAANYYSNGEVVVKGVSHIMVELKSV